MPAHIIIIKDVQKKKDACSKYFSLTAACLLLLRDTLSRRPWQAVVDTVHNHCSVALNRWIHQSHSASIRTISRRSCPSQKKISEIPRNSQSFIAQMNNADCRLSQVALYTNLNRGLSSRLRRHHRRQQRSPDLAQRSRPHSYRCRVPDSQLATAPRSTDRTC